MKEYTFTTFNIYKAKRPFARSDMNLLCGQSDFMALQEWVNSVSTPDAHHVCMSERSMVLLRKKKTGTAIFSKIAPIKKLSFVSKHREIGFLTKKHMTVAIYPLEHTSLTIFNCHALNFVTNSMWKKNIDRWLAYIPQDGAVIVAGDFNTWNARRFAHLNNLLQKKGFAYAPYSHTNFLKLDHIWVRDIDIVSTHCHHGIRSSDHRPITLKFTLQVPEKETFSMRKRSTREEKLV